jgi:hypothetical protein
MMQLLHTDGAGIAIGISLFFIVVGVVMKRVFVKILKQGVNTSESFSASSEASKHD